MCITRNEYYARFPAFLSTDSRTREHDETLTRIENTVQLIAERMYTRAYSRYINAIFHRRSRFIVSRSLFLCFSPRIFFPFFSSFFHIFSCLYPFLFTVQGNRIQARTGFRSELTRKLLSISPATKNSSARTSARLSTNSSSKRIKRLSFGRGQTF